MAERLRVVLEFKKTDINELELYAKLIEFSNPAAVVKDILKGTLPLEIIMDTDNLKE